MLGRVRGIFKKIILVLLLIFLVFVSFFFIGSPPLQEGITWGVNFSQTHAQNLGLSWKETYLALLEDLGAKNLRVATYWDLLEPEDDQFFFEDLDWQIKEAEKHQVKVFLVVGVKTPRWPECYIPEWAKNLSIKQQQEEVLELIQEVVIRYKDSEVIKYWQVENEPLFPYGECFWIDKNFLKKEIDLVKFLDPQHPVVITDSGEFSLWFNAAYFGDIAGTTFYKKIWSRVLRMYVYYPFPPVFYWRKTQLIKKLFGKSVICVELQAEPWGPALMYDLSLEEQTKTMNLEQFRNIIKFVKRTGFAEHYFWGAEWWYWLKMKENDPRIWEEAKLLFNS